MRKREPKRKRAVAPRTTYIALDTSVYLHCRIFTEVEWPTLVDRARVVLLLPSPVLSELDKHKDQHPHRKRRERARAVIAQFKKAQQDAGFEFRKGVGFMSYRRALTQKDFRRYGLDRERPDERILATLLRFQAEHPHDEVILIARDGNMCFMAAELGLPVVDPTSIEERDEPDEAERQLEALKRRATELESRVPRLSLAFEDENNFLKFGARPFVPTGEDGLQRLQAERLRLYPPVGLSHFQDGPSFLGGEVRRYREEHAAYVDELAEYFQDLEAWRDREARTISFVLRLANVGRVPAESVSVQLLVTASAHLETDGTRPKPPVEPDPPGAPRNFVDIGSIVTATLQPSQRAKYIRGFGPSEAEEREGQRGSYIYTLGEPEITESPGKGVLFSQEFKRIQQAKHESIGPLHLVFPDVPQSLGIRFTLRADMMDPHEGELHVIVE